MDQFLYFDHHTQEPQHQSQLPTLQQQQQQHVLTLQQQQQQQLQPWSLNSPWQQQFQQQHQAEQQQVASYAADPPAAVVAAPAAAMSSQVDLWWQQQQLPMMQQQQQPAATAAVTADGSTAGASALTALYPNPWPQEQQQQQQQQDSAAAGGSSKHTLTPGVHNDETGGGALLPWEGRGTGCSRGNSSTASSSSSLVDRVLAEMRRREYTNRIERILAANHRLGQPGSHALPQEEQQQQQALQQPGITMPNAAAGAAETSASRLQAPAAVEAPAAAGDGRAIRSPFQQQSLLSQLGLELAYSRGARVENTGTFTQLRLDIAPQQLRHAAAATAAAAAAASTTQAAGAGAPTVTTGLYSSQLPQLGLCGTAETAAAGAAGACTQCGSTANAGRTSQQPDGFSAWLADGAGQAGQQELGVVQLQLRNRQQPAEQHMPLFVPDARNGQQAGDYGVAGSSLGGAAAAAARGTGTGASAAATNTEVIRFARVITCKTYLKRLNITQPMAEQLLPYHNVNSAALHSSRATAAAAAAAVTESADSDVDAHADADLAHPNEGKDIPSSTGSAGNAGSSYELLFKETVTLLDSSGNTYSVQYEGVSCNNQKHLRLTKGWVHFTRANNVNVGDAVLFERRGQDRHSLRIIVIRNSPAEPAGSPKTLAAGAVNMPPAKRRKFPRKEAVQQL